VTKLATLHVPSQGATKVAEKHMISTQIGCKVTVRPLAYHQLQVADHAEHRGH